MNEEEIELARQLIRHPNWKWHSEIKKIAISSENSHGLEFVPNLDDGTLGATLLDDLSGPPLYRLITIVTPVFAEDVWNVEFRPAKGQPYCDIEEKSFNIAMAKAWLECNKDV